MTTSQVFTVIFGVIGGLGLFLYGMKLMSEGLQKTSGNGLKKILEKLTSNRIIGTAVGAVVTSIIQSSSATTVMVVGFVNAGLMSLTQALSVILGANIGTTITAQIIAFKVSAISLPAIGIGAIIVLFINKPTVKYIGEIILGFGLLFYGMDIMTKAFVPLSKSQAFIDIFAQFSHQPILAVLAGTITTLIVQSSSATLGITIALASTGVLDFNGAAALVLGENIGTTITANIAAINANRVAKQAALGHFLFNTIGVIYMIILLSPFIAFINAITPGDVYSVATGEPNPYAARHIANLHTMFNIINTLVFLPFLPLLAKLCEKIIKPDPKMKDLPKIVHLSDAMISTPEIAVRLAKEETVRMFETSLNILDYSKNALLKSDKESATFAKDLSPHLDLFDAEINNFLLKLSSKTLSDKAKKDIRSITHAIEEIKQIGERGEKIIKISQKLDDKKVVFSKEAKQELNEIFNNVTDFASNVFEYYKNNKRIPETIDKSEEIIDKQRKTFKKNHIKRLNSGECSLEAGLLFVDILSTLEKTGDDVYSVAQLLPRN